MDKTIKNLDQDAFLSLRAQAVLQRTTIGKLVSEAIKTYLARPLPGKAQRSLTSLLPFQFGEETKNLSSEIDDILYKE